MCWFIFVGVPKGDESVLRGEVHRIEHELVATSNRGVIAAFPKGDFVGAVIRGGCSCGLYGDPRAKFDEDAERRSYEKRGWSAAKIDRAMLGRRRPHEGVQAVAFRDAFGRIVRAAGGARIAAHEFSGGVDSEEVTLQHGGIVHLTDFLDSSGTYERDVVHDVRL